MHCEQVVTQKFDGITWLLMGIILVFAILLCNFIFSNILFLVGVYGLLIYPVVFGIIWAMFRRLCIEFEYEYDSGVLKIEKITAKSNRSVLAVCDLHKAVLWGPAAELPDVERTNPSLPCIYAQGTAPWPVFYLDYLDDTHRVKRLFISPNPDMLQWIEKSIPTQIKRQLPE